MTFDPIYSVYVRTVPRPKSTKSGYKIAKNLSTSRRAQHIEPGIIILDNKRLSVAEHGHGNRYDKSRVEAETTTPNCDESDDVNSLPPIEETLDRALRDKHFDAVGEHCSIDNTGREGEKARTRQKDKSICNSTATPSNDIGNTRDNPIIVADDSNLSTVESDFWSGSVGTGRGDTGATLFSPATTPAPGSSATPCQDFDPAEFGSSAAASVLGIQSENKPLALIPNSQSDILDEETQRRPGAGGEGDCGSGNTSPCDLGLGESGNRPSSAKRKQPSSHSTGLVQQYKRRLQSSASHSRPRLDGATGGTEHDTKGRLPSLVPSIAHTADIEMSSSGSDLNQPLKGGLPTLTEVTFRPRSPRSCSFTAVVHQGCKRNRMSLALFSQLIKGIGCIGEPDISAIKSLQGESFLITGIYPVTETYGTGNSPSDSDFNTSSDDNDDNGYCSKDKQDGASPRKESPVGRD